MKGLLHFLTFASMTVFSVENSFAGRWDGEYISTFQYQMTRASLCPESLTIRLSITVDGTALSGSIENLGSANRNAFCNVYNNGSITGTIDTNGNIIKADILQEDVHSAQYSSYAISGNLSGELKLLSRSKKFHPTKVFQLTKTEVERPILNITDSSVKVDLVVVSDSVGDRVPNPKLSIAKLETSEPVKESFNSLPLSQRKNVQKILQQLGLYRSAIDGQWGQGTASALNQYLKEHSEHAEVTVVLSELSSLNVETYPQGNLAETEDRSESLAVAEPTLQTAQDLIVDLESFVAKGSSEFDLSFAKKYRDLSPVKNGLWNEGLKRAFVELERYALSYADFEEYREIETIRRESIKQEKLNSLNVELSQNTKLLNEWAKANLLDPRSARIAELLDASENVVSRGDLKVLTELADAVSLEVAKLGINLTTTSAVGGSLDFESDAIYVFGNFSGRAENIFKGLDGESSFDGGRAVACFVGSWDRWQRYSVTLSLNDQYGIDELAVERSGCEGTEDLFIVSGDRLLQGTFSLQLNPDQHERLFFISRSQAIASKQKLELMSDLLKQDILSGSKVGYGIIAFTGREAPMCILVDGPRIDHVAAIDATSKILLTYIDRSFGYSSADDVIDVFRKIQKRECGSVYSESSNLAKLIAAADNNSMESFVVPVWVPLATLAEISEKRISEEQEAALTREALAQNQALRDEARKAAQQKSKVLEASLREKHSVRFSALLDELSNMLNVAVNFAFSHSPLDKNYQESYLNLEIIDPIDSSSSAFDPIIGDLQKLALEKWEMTAFATDKVDFGETDFNNRVLEGVIVELNVSIKNRVIGTFDTYCRTVRAIKDEDFDMWRRVEIDSCGSDNASWKQIANFRSNWIVNADDL